MADRPILFSAPMIRALLDGRKTQTRRTINFPGIENVIEFVRVAFDKDTGAPIYEMKDAGSQFVTRPKGKNFVDYHYSPNYAAADRLYVREAWHAARSLDGTPPRDIPRYADIEHAATARSYAEIGLKGKLRPAMFLPRWASRITLIVTDVRVQRLQEISEEDAAAEGCIPDDSSLNPNNVGPARQIFRCLWDSLNADRGFGWDANPWIVAVTFRVINQNIDQIEGIAA